MSLHRSWGRRVSVRHGSDQCFRNKRSPLWHHER